VGLVVGGVVEGGVVDLDGAVVPRRVGAADARPLSSVTRPNSAAATKTPSSLFLCLASMNIHPGTGATREYGCVSHPRVLPPFVR
jgi:hypothetical protein